MLADFTRRCLIFTGLLLTGMLRYEATAMAASEDTTPPNGCTDSIPAEEKLAIPPGASGAERIEFLIKRGETYQALGHYHKALMVFDAAIQEARRQNHPGLEIAAMLASGHVHLLQDDPDGADPILLNSFEKASAIDHSMLMAACANRLGNLSTQRNQKQKALKWYQKALLYAKHSSDSGLEAAIRKNLAYAADSEPLAVEHLKAAKAAAEGIALSEERAWLLLEIAAEARQRWTKTEAIAFRYHTLIDVYTIAGGSGDARLFSHAAGSLGRLYEEQGRLQEALDLTLQAIKSAGKLQAHDLLLQWQWQAGRLLRAQGRRKQALAAMRRAVFHIQEIRQDIPIKYHDGRSTFRETLSPIYLELADLLLEQASTEPDRTVAQKLLHDARETVELIKQSEMRDYFKDPCIVVRSRKIESLAENTAVLYPIIMTDRLELLVDIDGRLFRKTTNVSREELESAVRSLVGDLRNRSTAFVERSRTVFDWLLKPIMAIVEEHGMNTLVFVPDGVLRMLPIAALWDGDSFLVEHYGVATVPGLTLLDSNPLPRGDLDMLLAGMSEPGPVILDLPDAFWETLSGVELADVDRNVRGITTVTAPQNALKSQVSVRKLQEKEIDHVKKALALPGVSKEIRRLSERNKGQVLMDTDFRLEAFSNEFQRHPYRVVHIASHGFFGGDQDQNFIMTYDKLLTMNRLEAMVKTKQMAAFPLELLTLSACQTAEGDDRSPLGLTGVALKFGARSALGSLWPVSDEAAQLLLPAFYAHLSDSEKTKAEALRHAQIELMKRPEFRHPFYWSSFILAGNWL